MNGLALVLRVAKDALIGRATCFPKYSPLAIERRKKNVSMSMGELSSCVAILLFAKGVFVLITTSISFNSETDSIHTNQRYVKNFVCTGFLWLSVAPCFEPSSSISFVLIAFYELKRYDGTLFVTRPTSSKRQIMHSLDTIDRFSWFLITLPDPLTLPL